MTDDVFSAVQERIDKFSLSRIHTPQEWQVFFEDGILLLDHPDEQTKYHAIERMQKAIWSENNQHYRQPDIAPVAADRRLLPILSAISTLGDEWEQYLLRFTMWSSLSDEQKGVLSEWLAAKEVERIVTADTVSTAKIQAELYPANDWNEAKLFLEPLFNHRSDLLRAAAANAFGELYLNGAENLPPLDEVMEQVKQWEIERPGFAGPFIGQLLMDFGQDGAIAGSGVKLTDWILEVIAKRRSDEPCVPFITASIFTPTRY